MSATAIITPDRTLAQRMDALQKANRVRSRRAQLKRDLKRGGERAVNLIASPPDYVDTMKIMDLLLAAPKVGRAKATRMLRKADVSPSKTLGDLSRRQRDELMALLGGSR